MAPSRVPPQDPSTSPTFSMSTNQPQPPVHSSLRRNLFAGHLSRRPTSNTPRDPFAASASSQSQFGQPHADIFPSGQSLLSSKRNNVAFQDIYDADSHEASDPAKTALTVADNAASFSRETIIAIHPVTGRPILPNIPNLPPRLRLSDDEDEEGYEEGSNVDHDPMVHAHHQLPHHRGAGAYMARSPSYQNNPSHRFPDEAAEYNYDPNIEIDSSELETISSSMYNLQGQSISELRQNLNNILMDTDPEESRADRKRIERVLSSMVARQRARAKATSVSTIPGEAFLGSSTNESSVTQHQNGSTATTRSGSSAAVASRSRRGVPETKDEDSRRSSPQRFDLSSSLLHKNGKAAAADIGPVGPSMDPLEKDELMGLIMTSLTRKLQVAEEEGWMYGGAEGLGGVHTMIGIGEDGVYD